MHTVFSSKNSGLCFGCISDSSLRDPVMKREDFYERNCYYISLPRYTRGASVVNLDPQCFRPNLVFFTFLLHNYYIFLLQFCLYFCHCFLTFLLHFVTFCYIWIRGVSALCCHFGPTIIQPPRIQLLFIKLQGIHSNQSF